MAETPNVPPGRSRILAAVLARFATPQRPWRTWYCKFPNLAQFYSAFDLLDVFADSSSEIAVLMSELRIRERLQHQRGRPAALVGPIDWFAAFAWSFVVRWHLDQYLENPAHHERALRELFGIQGIRLEDDREEWLFLACTLEKARPESFLLPAVDTQVDALRTMLLREYDRRAKQDQRQRSREWIPDDLEFLNKHATDVDDLDQIVEDEATKAQLRAVRAVFDELGRVPLPVEYRCLLPHWRAGRVGAEAAKAAAKQASRPEDDWKVIHQGLLRMVQRRLAAGQD